MQGQTFLQRLEQHVIASVANQLGDNKRLITKTLGDSKTKFDVSKCSFGFPLGQARRGAELEQGHDGFPPGKVRQQDTPGRVCIVINRPAREWSNCSFVLKLV